MDNLSSLLLMLAKRPSQQVVDAVIRFTQSAYWRQPTLTVASALLPQLEDHSKWKARCLRVIVGTGDVTKPADPRICLRQ